LIGSFFSKRARESERKRERDREGERDQQDWHWVSLRLMVMQCLPCR